MDVINLITSCQLLPLATLTSKDQVEPLCKVLINVGLPLIEITLRDEKTLDILDEVIDDIDNTIITLNGWLRIVPPDKCSKYNIYNGHPGLITRYPELKGKDPQQRAWDDLHKYYKVGSVVHKVVEEVDAGDVETVSEASTASILTIDDTYDALRKTSLEAWYSFLKERLYNKV